MYICPKGIVVCVNYDDLLRITLHRNLRHMSRCLVVTSPQDVRTQEYVQSLPNASLHVTDAFYRYGAKFNKGLAIEEGFDVLGRDGWILAWDADTLLPDTAPFYNLNPQYLYGAKRRIVNDPTRWDPKLPWSRYPLSNDRAWPGYFQLFHSSATFIRELPWHDVTFAHAGGGDGYFDSRYPIHFKKKFPNWEVLHLGPRDTNWFGRASKRIDGGQTSLEALAEMNRFLEFKGWRKTGAQIPEDYRERVDVPGVTPTGYVLTGNPAQSLRK